MFINVENKNITFSALSAMLRLFAPTSYPIIPHVDICMPNGILNIKI